MWDNIKHKAWIEILLASASAVFGLIVGALLEKAMDSLFSVEVRAVLVSVLVLGLMIIVGLVAVGIFVRRNDEQRIALAREIYEIQRKIGLSADFVCDLPRGEATGELYRKAAEVIERAETSIWILWCHRHPSPPGESEEALRSDVWNKACNHYHQLILQKCHEHKRDTFFYRRVLQLPESANVKDGVLSSEMLTITVNKHCRSLLDFVRQYPESAVLKYAPLFVEQTFALVDNRYILWEIDAIDPDIGSRYMDGLLVFDDTGGEFARYLRNFFLKVDAHSAIVRKIVD